MMTEPESMTAEACKPKKKPEPRRPGGEEKRGENKWLLRIFRGYDANGKRIYFSETFHGGSKEADRKLIELHNRHKAGEPLKFVAKTFKDFFDQWIQDVDDGERRECTIDQYRHVGEKLLIPAFGKFALTDITDAAILRFYADMRKKKYAQTTIRRTHVVLSGVLKAAEAADLLLRNPMYKIKARKKTPKTPKSSPVAMDDGQVKAFLDAVSQTPEGFMFRLAFFLGARPCEYLGLQWGDVGWEGKRITIQRSLKRRNASDWYTTPPKTDQSVRTIALTPALIKALEAHKRGQLEARLKAGPDWEDHKFIFTDEVGRRSRSRPCEPSTSGFVKRRGCQRLSSLR